MAHKMGLVKIILGTKNVPTTRNYSASGSHAADDTGMKYTDAAGTTTVTASSSFDDSCKPYNPNSANYWYVIRGTTAEITHKKTFKSATTVNTDWEYTDVSVNQGKYREITVNNSYIKRLCYKFTAVFSCTQTCQEFKLPVKGSATYECWGANGASEPGSGMSSYTYGTVGYGGYTKGTASFAKGTQLYIYVGAVGSRTNAGSFQVSTGYVDSFNAGGWNGGGDSGNNVGRTIGAGGGGATDIRLVNCSTTSTWNETSSLRSRIMVAGGGGGAVNHSRGGKGGGLTGESGQGYTTYTADQFENTGGEQTKSGTCPLWSTDSGSALLNEVVPTTGQYYEPNFSVYGAFGYARGGENYWYGGGGGGGWYGGVLGYGRSGSGGSSFISGHSGCNAVNTSTGAHLGTSTKTTYNSVTYEFTGTSMTQGATNSPGGNNGYAKITMDTPVND